MDEKITITAELGKNEVSALFFLIGEELTDERWESLSRSPIALNFDVWGKEERTQLKALLISAAMLSTNIE